MKIQKLNKLSFKFYTDGVRTIKVKNEDEIPNGFHPGRTFKSNPWNKGLTAKTNERVKANGQATRETRLNNNSYVAWNKWLTQETDDRVSKNITNMKRCVKDKYGVDNITQYLSQQSSYKVWNKGITKEINDSVRKISDSNKGKVPWNKGLNIQGHPQSEETKEKLRQIHLNPEFKQQRYCTMKNKGTLFTFDSKAEKIYYEKLKSQYGEDNVIRQHFDKERYPFKCDFYIPSKDKFIEIHANWTHGGKPFDSSDKECNKKLELWKEKAKTSYFYKNAIYQWTNLDIRKVQCAEKNNLNFEAIYC